MNAFFQRAVSICLVPALLLALSGRILAADPVPRHALETDALVEPEVVLRKLPALIAAASEKSDQRELALLHLAEANACRVMANWECQRNAGRAAIAAAEGSGDPVLIVRGLINESRARMALQDFTGGEQLLGRAELLLKDQNAPELAADVSLAYSSMSHAIGKHQLAAEYAERGLQQLGAETAAVMRARLLRNEARARAHLGDRNAARALLSKGVEVSQLVQDPKLTAEMYLESARLARADRDHAGVQQNAEQIFALARQLRNTQLEGLGHEIIGQSAMDQGELVKAAEQLKRAVNTFHALGLDRDELRVARDLVGVLLDTNAPRAELADAMRRVVKLDRDVISSDRALAADDFDARLRYAEQQLDVVRLSSEALIAAERAQALARTNRLSLALGIVMAVSLLALMVFFLLQQRANRRLRNAITALRDSEMRAADVLRLSRGYVFLHDLQGRVLLANPAVAEVLGQREDQLIGQSLANFIEATGQTAFQEYLEQIRQHGHAEGLLRIRHRRGGERSWRYQARLNPQVPEHPYVIGHAVDVTDQVEQTEALREQNLHDELTGCYNRRYLARFERAHEAQQRWGVINLDLDHFKRINDSLGHEEGDRVLREFTTFLQQRARSSDALVRSGGDEFLLLLADADESRIEFVSDRLREDRSAAPCAYSFGHAIREPGESLSETIARADAQMYQARNWARGTGSATRGR